VNSACLRYAAGEVFVIQGRSGALPFPFEAPGGFYFENSGILSRKLYVAPGEELLVLDRLRGTPGLLFSSLNYLASSSSRQARPYVPEGDEMAVWITEKGGEQPIFNGGKCQNPTVDWSDEDPAVVIIDFEAEAHCPTMMQRVREGFRSVAGDAPLHILGAAIRNCHWTSYDLFLVDLLARAVCELRLRIDAVVMAFDIGVFCNAQYVSHPLLATAFSFPVFDDALDRLWIGAQARWNDSESQKSPFCVFAAAGNTYASSKRWRLAYPAINYRTIAVTCMDVEGGRALPCIDLPAVYDYKPCIAVDAKDIGMPSQIGTSDATAWTAGRHAALNLSRGHRRFLGPLAIAADIQRSGEYSMRRIEPDPDASRPWCPINVLVRDSGHAMAAHAVAPSDPMDDLAALAGRLNEALTPAEFAVTGSLAFLAQHIRHRDRSFKETLAPILSRGWIFDIDLKYTGGLPPERMDRATIDSIVKDWLHAVCAPESQVPMLGSDILPLDQYSCANLLSECLIPPLRIVVSASGPIRVWDYSEDFDASGIDLIIPEKETWELNPEFRNGANGVARGVLLWIKAVALYRLVDRLCDVPSSDPDWVIEKAGENARILEACPGFLRFGYPKDGGGSYWNMHIGRAESLVRALAATTDGSYAALDALTRSVREKARLTAP
jgi:hypothetical protein